MTTSKNTTDKNVTEFFTYETKGLNGTTNSTEENMNMNSTNNVQNELPTAPIASAKIALNTNITSTMLSPELVKHEKGIRTAQKAFYTIGENLNYITKHGLYLERGFSTFETYVDLMFDMSRGYAYKMMDAFRVKTVLLAYGFKVSELPKTESQCRVLIKLIEKDGNNCDTELKAVWSEVLKGAKITAKSIDNAVNKALGKAVIIPPVSDNPDNTTGKNEETNGELPTDNTGTIDKTLTITQSATQDLIDSIKEKNEEILRLKAELAQVQVTGKKAKSKLEIELIKAGFKALAASTSPENMPELIKIKDSYLA